MITRTMAIAAGIQRGDRTHHQDQAITLHNFKTINAMARRPHKPTPPPDDEELLLIYNNVFSK